MKKFLYNAERIQNINNLKKGSFVNKFFIKYYICILLVVMLSNLIRLNYEIIVQYFPGTELKFKLMRIII